MKRTLARKTAVSFLAGLLLLAALAGTAFGFGRGTTGPDVYAVQGMLKSLGYYAGKIDGSYGPLTEAGVKAFQRQYGLPVTGAVDGKTLEAILWAYGNLKIPRVTPTPTPTPAPRPAPTPPPAPRPAPAPLAGLSAEEQQMLGLVNQERRANGLAALAADPILVKTARLKSQDMVDKNYFAHQSPTYGSPFEMLKQFGITYRLAGENIACNQSVMAAHQALMNSQGHRANILNKDYTHIGIGIVNGGPCGKMFTQQFIGK